MKQKKKMSKNPRRDNKRKDKLVPKKEKEALLFALWMSIPSSIKSATLSDVEGFGYDIDDKLFLELKNLRTKKQFAEHFKISTETISDWVKSDWVKDKTLEINKAHITKIIPDINHAFIKKTLKEADAPRIKLFKQLFEGWVEKSEQSMPEMKEALKGIQNGIVKLITQEKNKK